MSSHALETLRSKLELLTLILLQSFQQTDTATSASEKLYDPKLKTDRSETDAQGPKTAGKTLGGREDGL